jgi:hypothetical protein
MIRQAKKFPIEINPSNIYDIVWHRNGQGAEFHTVLFLAYVGGRYISFMATVFDAEGAVAVVDRGQVGDGEIVDCYKGSDFEPALRAAIKDWREGR